MNVIEYLQQDGASISEHFAELTANYTEWAQERIFAETKNELAATHSHFEKEVMLINNLKNTSHLTPVLKEADEQRQAILSDIENLTMLHVDEPGFEQGLQSIAKHFSAHREFCKTTFFPRLKNNLTARDLKEASAQLDEKILS